MCERIHERQTQPPMWFEGAGYRAIVAAAYAQAEARGWREGDQEALDSEAELYLGVTPEGLKAAVCDLAEALEGGRLEAAWVALGRVAAAVEALHP